MRSDSLSAMVSAVPDGRPEERVHPAEHHGEDDPQRHADPGQRLGVDVRDVLRVGDAAERGQRRRQHRDADLEPRHVDPDGGRRRLVLPDRLHRGPGHRTVEPPPHPEPGRPQDERPVVEDPAVGELDGEEAVRASRLEREPERAAGPVALGDDEQPDHLADRQRHQREVVADHPEAGARVRNRRRRTGPCPPPPPRRRSRASARRSSRGARPCRRRARGRRRAPATPARNGPSRTTPGR